MTLALVSVLFVFSNPFARIFTTNAQVIAGYVAINPYLVALIVSS